MSNLLWGCGICDWIGKNDDLLRAPNPFRPEDEIVGCPKCQAVEDFFNVCDEPGCKVESTCGFPTPSGYRRTCGEHYRIATASTRNDKEERK